MLDDFFSRALIAGVGVAMVAGPLGCFVVWRRMAYLGDTIAHSGLLGLSLAFLIDINLTLGVFVAACIVSLCLIGLERSSSLSSDAILGLLAHSSLAIGLVVIALMTWVRIDLMGYLFGDILAVTRSDILVVYAGGAIALGVIVWFWRALLADTASHDLAQVEGMQPKRARLVLMMVLALVIAITMKIVGVLLITALLVIPAAAARRFASGPELMAVFAAAIGIVAVVLGLFGSLQFDTPSGPSIVVAALVLFILSLLPLGSWPVNSLGFGRD